jgi:transposase-like protein
MNRVAKRIKKNKDVLRMLGGEEFWEDKVADVISRGKKALDQMCGDLGRTVAEILLLMDRENVSGADHHPKQKDLHKWGFQGGSVFLGEQKMKVSRPRLRSGDEEVPIQLYEKIKHPGEFSDEMLARALRGLSGRKYKETITALADGFGISRTSVSNRFIEAGYAKLKAFRERRFDGFRVFAVFLDTVHRGGAAFTIALGIDTKGRKSALGLWEGATENKEVALALLSDLKSRGLLLHRDILFVTDGGGGIISALNDLFGKYLIHQRCTIHKDRNIQRHLPKKYRREAHRRFRDAINLKTYEDAKKELMSLKNWLKTINESSARSLEEAMEEVLTLHRLGVPELLRQTLHSTNPIESVFSTVRECEKNIKRYRGSKMSQRWLASVLLHAENNFRTVRGHKEIPWVIQKIKVMRKKSGQDTNNTKDDHNLAMPQPEDALAVV